MNRPCPRLLLAALRGGAGKTTLTLGLLAAWRDQGRRLVPFKKGPDYIDPAWHALAAGCPSHNLDPFLMEGDQIMAMVARHASRQTPCSSKAIAAFTTVSMPRAPLAPANWLNF